MTFTVTYRDATGALVEERVEAAGRAECFAQMCARGIAPVHVKKGGAKHRVGGGAGAKSPSVPPKALLAAACAVLLSAGGVWWWLSRGEKDLAQEPSGPKSSSSIATVPPAPVPKPVATETNVAPQLSKRERQLKQIRDKYGDNIPENLKSVVYFLENPPQQTFHPARTKASIFKRRSEREIASMIMTEPGTWFMRRPTFGDRFDSDFKASLDERIEFAEDDTPEQRELKQAVIDTKKELAERMRAGEKPSDAMNAFAGSMYDLGQYRRTLQDELGKIKRDASYTDKDIQEFVDAANKMLKEKGAQPIPMPKMVFRHVSLKKAAMRAAAQEKLKKGIGR